MVNGENAALKAPKFSKPNERAQHALFDDFIDEFSGKKKNEEEVSSPLMKIFSSLNKKRSSKTTKNGSLNELRSEEKPSSPLGKFAQSPNRDSPAKESPSKMTPTTATSAVPRTELKSAAGLVENSALSPQTAIKAEAPEGLSNADLMRETMKDPSPISI